MNVPLRTLLLTIAVSASAAPVDDLHAVARDGQVFLTWKEAETPSGTTFNVYASDRAIAKVTEAKKIAHHIEQHSARDWWEDPASFKKGVERGVPVGFRIEGNGQPLDPQLGLFVHTVPKGAKGKMFFAVTSSDAGGKEDITLVPGANALADGIAAAPGEIKPIWQREGEAPAPGSGKGLPLWLSLHAKGGVVANMEYLVFGDETMGWREGLPFKFSVRVQGDEVVVQPTDRVWINRPHKEASDGGTNAIWTFWYGYNSHIYDRGQMGTGTPTNYTERRNLWILDWVRRQYQPDTNRWYCSGGSMGGCGTMSFAWRHPELFAAGHARVPIVSYTHLGKNSAVRLEPSCWTGPIAPDLRTDEGVSLLDRMNGTKFATESHDDLPFIFLLNGRQDGSIPWDNNPPFYRAMEAARQGFAAYWDNGEHSTCGKDAPKDVQAWTERFRRIRRDQSYPAFTHTSSDRNPGNGAADDGDIIGWINRGMDWKDVEDTPDHYSIVVLADYEGVEYPVRTDVTLRRVQQFKTKPGEKVSARVGDANPISITADSTGRITIPQVSIPSATGVRVTVRRD
jgi:pimeloyl-ACP methyl ester carboxylesterase